MGFIKICGMTDTLAVTAALAARVDAIGFVFAPSVRQVTAEQASVLAQPARGKVLCVAVTQHPDATSSIEFSGSSDPMCYRQIFTIWPR
jgi:phosphoribosylanthranilate isomerase